MFHTETMKVSDFRFAVTLANTMNWDMEKEDFEFNFSLEPNGCFVLFDDSRRIGIATCISFGRIGWFGNLVVNKKYRNKGCGKLLMEKAIDYLKGKGAKTIGLYAYQHLVKYYEEIGFKPSTDFSVIKGKIISKNTKNEAESIDMDQWIPLVEFDRRCLKWDRKKLLESINIQSSSLGYLSRRNNQIVGYIMAKLHEGMAEIGPLVCLKDAKDSSEQLVKIMLSKLGGWDAFVCLPTENADLVQILGEAGLEEKYRLTRMFLGPATDDCCTYIAESLERG